MVDWCEWGWCGGGVIVTMVYDCVSGEGASRIYRSLWVRGGGEVVDAMGVEVWVFSRIVRANVFASLQHYGKWR
ncbi:MAG: hypothetical protein C4B59_15920 [Candidatus Methanogaster sp.]|uniref:Uncharacterized protein n=1 Tax=Candidatus Methanogaster sp. TaxID=3386292 RepID=A0AC61KYH0_9EURY|nr:MAG: hypothetical protein C4B59_15920 [ANME-2 cluster archaeon]